MVTRDMKCLSIQTRQQLLNVTTKSISLVQGKLKVMASEEKNLTSVVPGRDFSSRMEDEVGLVVDRQGLGTKWEDKSAETIAYERQGCWKGGVLTATWEDEEISPRQAHVTALEPRPSTRTSGAGLLMEDPATLCSFLLVFTIKIFNSILHFTHTST